MSWILVTGVGGFIGFHGIRGDHKTSCHITECFYPIEETRDVGCEHNSTPYLARPSAISARAARGQNETIRLQTEVRKKWMSNGTDGSSYALAYVQQGVTSTACRTKQNFEREACMSAYGY